MKQGFSNFSHPILHTIRVRAIYTYFPGLVNLIALISAVLRIQILHVTLMRIRIRILPFTLMRIQIWIRASKYRLTTLKEC
jgi:hypothetical protein